MIIVDTALERRYREGNPVRVGIVGAGYMGRGMAMQILRATPGMRLVAVANRTLANAVRAYEEAGESCRPVHTADELADAVRRNAYAATDDARLLCEAEEIDVIIEATGEVEYGARIALDAIRNGKHLVLMNAELDATVGPILKVYADRAGVVYTNVDGDQPGVVMNLLRWVRSIGFRPVLAGNIKGMLDHYRTPETQRRFAEANKQQVKMITSFADGTKLAMEMAVVANATGFKVGKRGMYGPACAHANDALGLFPEDRLLEGGMVDYILGAEPGPGVFVIGHDEHPIRQQYMTVYKMGEGPFYVFYAPYHFPHREAPLTAARAALFHDAAIAPQGAQVCDVITLAKRELRAGEALDGIGGFLCYGVLENSEVARRDRLLPMGLAEGRVLRRDFARDEPISYDDLEPAPERLADRLRVEQDDYFTTGLREGDHHAGT